jgi:hypothetical protein
MEGLLGERSWHEPFGNRIAGRLPAPTITCVAHRMAGTGAGTFRPACRSDQSRRAGCRPRAPPSGGAASGGGHAEGAARLADHLLGEAPFIVIPGHHLDQRGVHDRRQVQVNDGGARVANNVGRDQRIL